MAHKQQPANDWEQAADEDLSQKTSQMSLSGQASFRPQASTFVPGQNYPQQYYQYPQDYSQQYYGGQQAYPQYGQPQYGYADSQGGYGRGYGGGYGAGYGSQPA